MKKLLLLTTLLAGIFFASAQTQVTLLDESFEGYSLPLGWTTIDADGDGNNWEHNTVMDIINGHTGSGAATSYSKNYMTGDVYTPDNWLVSPPITLIGNSTLTFWRMVGYFAYAEHYGVYISTTSATDPSAFTLLFEETPTQSAYAWTSHTINLDNYTGNTVYIAFRHFNSTNKMVIALDDITVTCSASAPIITANPSMLQFANVPVGQTSQSQSVTVTAYNAQGTITATVPSPFEVSVDNSNFSSLVTFPSSNHDLYVRYTPTIEGSDSAVLSLVNGSVTTDIQLYGNSIDCGISDLPYEEDFNSLPEGVMPNCWVRMNPFDGYPMTTDDYTGYGDNSLMFKCNYNTYEPLYAVMPQMPYDLSSLQISFITFREGSYSGTFSVGYVTDPADTGTFVPVWSISGTQIGDNNPHPYLVSFENVNTSATNDDYYIAFKYKTSHNYYWFIDDIVVDVIPTCSTPSDLTANLITSTTATVNWTGNANNYNLYYKSSSDTAWQVIENLGIDSAGYTIENLLPITTYTWYVTALCDDGTTVPSLSQATFTTECSFYNTPYTEDFNASASLPACWSRYTGLANSVFNGGALNSATTGWNFNNNYAFGANHARLNIYGSDCNKWLVTPAINLNGLTNPVLIFDLALTSFNSNAPISASTTQADDKFMVIVSTDYGATWSAANATVWSNDSTGDYVFNQIPATGQNVSIPLTAFAGETVMIAFYGESTVNGNGDNDIHIDNVMVSYATTCATPTDLAIANVTDNSVTLSWTENGSATEWNIEYGPTGFQHGASNATTVVANTNPFTISNLGTSTYDFYVQANCGNEQSYWSNSISAMPGSFNMGVNGSDTLTTCSLIIFDNGGADGNYAAGCNSTLVLYPENAGESIGITGTYQTESNYDKLSVYDGVGTSGTLLGQFSGNGTIPQLIASNGPMTLCFVSDNNMQYSGFELNTFCSSCAPPGNLTASNITSNAADLSWNGQTNTYLLEYKSTSDTTWNQEVVSDTVYSLIGLTPTTTYTVRVYSSCNGDYSIASTITFSTTMGTTTLPYSTDFSDGSDQNWVLNNGSCTNHWVIGTVSDTTSALFVTSNGNTPGYNTNSHALVSAEKLFTVGDAAEFAISFDIKIGGETEFDFLKAYFAPSDSLYPAASLAANHPYASESYSTHAINFTNYLQYSTYAYGPYTFNETGNNIVHVTVNMPNPNANPTPNSTAKLVFVWRNDNSQGNQPAAVVYNVSIEELSCPAPSGLTVSNIGTTTADVAWIANGDETTWTLEYKETSGSTWNSCTVSGTPSYTLTGLNVGTTYQLRVQANCNADDNSIWVSTDFVTNCDAITTFPYTEGFEGGVLPDCWTQSHLTGVVNWTFQAGNHSNGSIDNAHGGSYNAYFFAASSTGNTTRMISPVFDLTNVTNPYLSYWYAQQSWGNDQDHLTVYYRTSPSAEWIMLMPHGSSVSIWTMDSVALPSPTATYQIAFEGQANYGYGIVLDDITIAAGSNASAVTVITDPASDLTMNSATLNATITNPDNVAITAKGFEWKEASAGTYTTVNVTGNTLTYSLSGLTENTQYTYRAFVTTATGTTYGNMVNFTTLPEDTPEPCDPPTELHQVLDENGTPTSTVAWTDVAGASQWNVQYALENEDWTTVTVNTTSYEIPGMQSDINYYIRVQAVCSDSVTSDWSYIMYMSIGLDSWIANRVTLYPNPAREYVDIRVDGDVNVKGMEVFDVYGKIVRTDVETCHGASPQTRINVSGLADGMYFVRVTTEKGAVTKTFVKK